MVTLLTLNFIMQETPVPSPEPQVSMTADSDSFEQSIAKFNLQFSAVVVGLLRKISEPNREESSGKLLNVFYR